ncbi:recombinase family protein [Alkalibacillus sp. S2W]|uniref:recombinase family protein n=1 Tax=Alkalibacillus sp. S2W TaxID=3386553 RepID=UPI00398D4C2E
MQSKKAVIYCRVSTVGQAEDGVSLDNQLFKCKSFLDSQAKTEYEVVKVFREEGKSGKNEWRDEFQNMMSYIRDNKAEVDAVCFYAINRLGRNVQLVLNTINELDDYNVSVLSVSDNLDTSNPMGRFVLTILASLSQLESEQIGQRVFDTMHYSSQQGTWQGARYYPYGYIPQNESDERGNKPLKIVPEQAEQIKLIFKYYTEGLDGNTDVGTFKIAKKLNELGHQYLREGAKNKEWTNKRVLDILKNAHFYAGWYYWNRTGTKEKKKHIKDEYGNRVIPIMSKRSKSYQPVKETYLKPKSEWSVGKGIHEPIISETTWKVAETKFEKRKNKNPNLDTSRQPKNYLTNILVCPQCGGKMMASTQTRNTKKKGEIKEVYYRCQRATAGEECNHNVIKEDYVLPIVKDAVFAYYDVYLKQKIKKVIISQLYNGSEMQREADNKITGLQQEIDNYLAKVEEGFTAYQDGMILKDNYLRLKNKYEDEINQLKQEIAQIESTREDTLVSSQQLKTIQEIINNFKNIEEYFDSLDKLNQIEFLKNICLKVEVNKDYSKRGAKSVSIKRIFINDEITEEPEELKEIEEKEHLYERFTQLEKEIFSDAQLRMNRVHFMIRDIPKIKELEQKFNIVFSDKDFSYHTLNITMHKKMSSNIPYEEKNQFLQTYIEQQDNKDLGLEVYYLTEEKINKEMEDYPPEEEMLEALRVEEFYKRRNNDDTTPSEELWNEVVNDMKRER